jgi:molecular chaperone GrpE
MPSSHATDAEAQPAEPQDARHAELEERNAQLEDRYKRALADLDNYRKRVARDTERRVTENRDAVLLDWLEAVDSVDRALSQMEPGHPAAPGLRAVMEQLEAILDRQGVSRLGAVGEPFDPERHEAIGVRETTETPDRTVAEVARSGFARGDLVLRPAQVIVARAPAGDG